MRSPLFCRRTIKFFEGSVLGFFHPRCRPRETYFSAWRAGIVCIEILGGQYFRHEFDGIGAGSLGQCEGSFARPEVGRRFGAGKWGIGSFLGEPRGPDSPLLD